MKRQKCVWRVSKVYLMNTHPPFLLAVLTVHLRRCCGSGAVKSSFSPVLTKSLLNY